MDHNTAITESIIGCAIRVHESLGAGLLESAYHTALCIELAKAGIKFERDPLIPLSYDGIHVGSYRPDLVVEGQAVVEIKSVLRFEPVFRAQMLTYLRITNLRVGLILNFNKCRLKDGITRVVL
ncbi:MAG: GxxExxY protein [Vicinamibacterales bacterium]